MPKGKNKMPSVMRSLRRGTIQALRIQNSIEDRVAIFKRHRGLMVECSIMGAIFSNGLRYSIKKFQELKFAQMEA